MLREIQRRLAGVRSRLRFQRGLDGLSIGAGAGALLGLSLEAMRIAGLTIEPVAPWLVLAGGSGLGWVIGMMLPIDWRIAARLTDRHYKLKDRALTALEFSSRPDQDELVRLQIQEAISKLDAADAKSVLPSRAPAYAPIAVTLTICMIGLMFVPISKPIVPQIDAAVQQVVQEQADTLEKTVVEELKELAEEVKEPELEQLAEEIEQIVEQLKAPDVDEREALAKLSEMQQQLTEALDKFNGEKTEAALKELASALEPASAMQPISESLKEGDYEKAAEQLENTEFKEMSRKERDAVADNLKKLVKKSDNGQRGELSDAEKELQEGLENENESQCRNAAEKMSSVAKKEGTKKSICKCLGQQLNKLGECKSQCQGAGQSKSEGPPRKTSSPSNQAGKSASNSPTGDQATNMDGNRRRENLTGAQGDGPSEREVSQAPEAEQEAARSYQAKYSEFKKQMEEVLESEPLPLGHRETVRKYFESIRPNATDAETEAKSEANSKQP